MGCQSTLRHPKDPRSRLSENSQKEMSIQKTLMRLETEYRVFQLFPFTADDEEKSWVQKLLLSKQFRCLVVGVILVNVALISVVESAWEWEQVADVPKRSSGLPSCSTWQSGSFEY